MSDQPRPRYLLLLEALPDEVPADVRLRALLKSALRHWRLRCVHCVESPPVPPDSEPKECDA